ncbi:MAG: trypsin-like peptidase domain-containing protein [bacterium]|nr:trypsin-like peptidase domain-containing protein [bacterium]
MLHFPLKKILATMGIAALLAFGGAMLKNEIQSDFDEKVAILEMQIASLGKNIEKLTGESSEYALSIQELQNRKEVREKSQDELLTGSVSKVAPSVVSIVVSKDVQKLVVEYVNPFGNDPMFKDFNIRVPVYRQQGSEQQKIGAGTGFLVKSNGYILTNRHVVSDAVATYTVLLQNGAQKKATVLYRDAENDFAILKIDGSGYTTATLGNSNTLKLGQTVIAIGNALGEYSNSVSVGIISGLNRAIEASDGGKLIKLEGVIQTDAAINPGNSGGPLITLQGEIVGVNVATVVGGSNISFAIPINKALPILESIAR